MRGLLIARALRVLLALGGIASLIAWPGRGVVRAEGGDLDSSFGLAGTVTLDFYTESFNEAHAIALQEDGKIVAAGTVWRGFDTYDFALARFTADGSLDPSFGSSGKVTTDFGNTDVARAVAVQSDGKIVAAGSAFRGSTDFDFAVARYNGDGSLDSSFGVGGKITTDFNGGTDIARALLIQPDGKIVVAGEALVFPSGRDFAVVRYNTNGSLDLVFGSGGKTTTDFTGDDRGYAISLQNDGKILVGGEGDGFGVARYDSNGRLDPTFGSGGKVSNRIFGGPLGAWSLAIQFDGKIVQGGWATIPNTQSEFLTLVRYKADGRLDQKFGTSGIVTTPLQGKGGTADSLAIQGDGKIVAGGSSITSDGLDEFVVVRLNLDGMLDDTFGLGGQVFTRFTRTFDLAHGIAIQADGKIVAGGIAGASFGLARYESGLRVPRIMTASVSGKQLLVVGENFDSGALILINGEAQKTLNDAASPATRLIGKKAGKKIRPGDRLRVQNADGIFSIEFAFTG